MWTTRSEAKTSIRHNNFSHVPLILAANNTGYDVVCSLTVCLTIAIIKLQLVKS